MSVTVNCFVQMYTANIHIRQLWLHEFTLNTCMSIHSRLFELILLPPELIIMLGKKLLFSNHNLGVFYLQIFAGPTDKHTVVEKPLPYPVRALCVRIYPLTWLELPCLRLEVLGCPGVWTNLTIGSWDTMTSLLFIV